MLAIICISLEVKCRFILSMQSIHALLGEMMSGRGLTRLKFELLVPFWMELVSWIASFRSLHGGIRLVLFHRMLEFGMALSGEIGCTLRHEEWYDCVRRSSLDPNLKLFVHVNLKYSVQSGRGL